MKLDDQSQMIVDGLNRNGVLPFSRFTAAEARNEIPKLRIGRPGVPLHEMPNVAEDLITTPDGSFRVEPTRATPASLMHSFRRFEP
jgi:hypothetical protein